MDTSFKIFAISAIGIGVATMVAVGTIPTPVQDPSVARAGMQHAAATAHARQHSPEICRQLGAFAFHAANMVHAYVPEMVAIAQIEQQPRSAGRERVLGVVRWAYQTRVAAGIAPGIVERQCLAGSM